jgi:hypothetical protein
MLAGNSAWLMSDASKRHRAFIPQVNRVQCSRIEFDLELPGRTGIVV